MNVRYADSTYGTAAAYAALVALLHRRRSGVGQFVDVSAVECMTSMIGDAMMAHALGGGAPQCDGNRHPGMAPHGVYPCLGGEWISIAAASEEAWHALAGAMGRPELAAHSHFRSLSARKAHEAELDQLLSAWTAGQGARELAAALQQRGVAAAKSQNSMDLVADPQLWSRGFFRELRDSAGQTKLAAGPSWRMSREAAIVDAAPRLGQHNAQVLGDILGLTAEQQRELEEAGVTR
jgi:crotonobetainyl-CoA:carnitine CoA-transferase CaiB-like acyl-CoA transferase